MALCACNTYIAKSAILHGLDLHVSYGIYYIARVICYIHAYIICYITYVTNTLYDVN